MRRVFRGRLPGLLLALCMTAALAFTVCVCVESLAAVDAGLVIDREGTAKNELLCALFLGRAREACAAYYANSLTTTPTLTADDMALTHAACLDDGGHEAAFALSAHVGELALGEDEAVFTVTADGDVVLESYRTVRRETIAPGNEALFKAPLPAAE